MWKNFFLYTRGEQHGIILLIVLILIVLIVRFSMPYWTPRYFDKQELDEEFANQVYELNTQSIAQNDSLIIDSLFHFNPNTVTDDQLISLGFSNYQRKSFLGYRSKVKSFTADSDLLKVYGIDTAFFIKLKRYIVLEDIKNEVIFDHFDKTDTSDELQWVNFNQQEDEFWNTHIESDSIRLKMKQIISERYITKSLPMQKIAEYSNAELYQWMLKNSKPRFSDIKVELSLPTQLIEINKADTTQLSLLKGIGSKLSLRIINYRNSLGGFYQVSQLLEVYGISEELFTKLQHHLTVDAALVKRLDLQNNTVEEISKHPYVNYNQAKELKNMYRKNKILKVTDNQHLKFFAPQEWDRIKPYLILHE